MKYLRYFKTQAEYDAAVTEGLALPNVAYVEGKSVYYAPLVAEVKSTVAGDIAYWDGNKVVFCASSDWDNSLGTPIGVVVIPSSHRNDGKSVVMSLANMSLKTPETGTLSDNDADAGGIIWGNSNVDLGLTNYEEFPIVDPETGTSSGVGACPYFATDLTGEFVICFDKSHHEVVESQALYKTIYTISNGYINCANGMRDSLEDEWDFDFFDEPADPCAPSPYLADGSKNPGFQVEGTAFAEIDGKANQAVIMAACTNGATGVIPNRSGAGDYPAARACSRFYTEGTNAGDWYLPSIGEIAYLFARISAISDSIEKLGSNAVMFGYCPYDKYLWSSTEFSAGSAWNFGACYGRAYDNYKDDSYGDYRVRAFCAL